MTIEADVLEKREGGRLERRCRPCNLDGSWRGECGLAAKGLEGHPGDCRGWSSRRRCGGTSMRGRLLQGGAVRGRQVSEGGKAPRRFRGREGGALGGRYREQSGIGTGSLSDNLG